MILKNKDLKRNFQSQNATIEELINNLNSNQIKISIIVGKNDELIGTVTDGDLRRGILSGLNLKDKIKSIINYNPKTIQQNNFNTTNVSLITNKFQIEHLPVLNKKKIAFLYLNKKKIKKQKKINNKIVIMAGGFGKRLKKLTKNCPKPLLYFKKKPLIQHVVDNAFNQGFRDFYISIHYLKEKIKEYFKKQNDTNANFLFLEEKKPLGTIGSLKLIKNVKKNFIVLNCDVITDVNLLEILKFHKLKKNIMTMGVKQLRYQNPYGVIKSKNNSFVSFEEKPSIDFEINAGIYVFSPKILQIIKRNDVRNIEDLIYSLKSKNYSISLYPIYENWLDLGTETKALKLK
tara:strand:- start:15355 stop:16392 length:1038 start_codon:yes stop_codon:yes gene_type:complete